MLFLWVIHVVCDSLFLLHLISRGADREKFKGSDSEGLLIRCWGMPVLAWVPLKQIFRQDFEDKQLDWKVIPESTSREVGKWDWETIHPPSVLSSRLLVWVRGSIPLGDSVDTCQLFQQRSMGTWILSYQLASVIGDDCYQGEMGWWRVKFPALSVYVSLHAGRVDTSN